jgi:hypothetical protein|tara:strand:- start:89 stop:562 length:474 start_codon:yes stop_codon:yes gene_type:complete
MAGMETVNSNNTKLPGAEIVIKTLGQIGSKQYSAEDALSIVAKESALDTADTVQFGNTVFLANRGTGDNKNKMVGRAFNVDTGKNYINNCLDYLEYLREKGITHYTTMFEGSEVLKLIQFMRRVMEDIDTDIYIAESASGRYTAYFRFGNDSIPRAF